MVIPLSSSVAIVGLLSGIAAPPIAAIVFIGEKIINRELEKLTTWRFAIEGNLNTEPDILFDYGE